MKGINYELYYFNYKAYIFIFSFYLLNHINPKRISNYTLFDYIETTLIVLISFYTLVNVDYYLFKGITIILFILSFNYLIKYIYLINPKIRYYLDNRVVIVSDGKINFKEIIKNRYILDELIIKLKEENISEIKFIKKAYLTNNDLIIITK